MEMKNSLGAYYIVLGDRL